MINFKNLFFFHSLIFYPRTRDGTFTAQDDLFSFFVLRAVPPLFLLLSANSVALCPAWLPPHSSLTFSLSLEEAVTAKSWIYAPMGDVCSSPWLQRLRTHRLVSFMCTYTLDMCMLYTHKGMNTHFWGISLKCQDFIASSTKPATKSLPPPFFRAGWFFVYGLISATCRVSTFASQSTLSIYVCVTQDSSIPWLSAQVHPIAAANEP